LSLGVILLGGFAKPFYHFGLILPHAFAKGMQAVDIQHLNGAVLYSHQAGYLQCVQGAVCDLPRKAAQARNLLLRDVQDIRGG